MTEDQVGIAGTDAVFEFGQGAVGVPLVARRETVGIADIGETTAGIVGDAEGVVVRRPQADQAADRIVQIVGAVAVAVFGTVES